MDSDTINTDLSDAKEEEKIREKNPEAEKTTGEDH
jgi:hypothetical protein